MYSLFSSMIPKRSSRCSSVSVLESDKFNRNSLNFGLPDDTLHAEGKCIYLFSVCLCYIMNKGGCCSCVVKKEPSHKFTSIQLKSLASQADVIRCYFASSLLRSSLLPWSKEIACGPRQMLLGGSIRTLKKLLIPVLYTPTCEIPALLYTYSLKMVTLLGGASLYSPL